MVRLIVYGWLFLEAGITGYLYYEAAAEMESSILIESLARLFCVGLMVGAYRVLAEVIAIFHSTAYKIMIDYTFIFIILFVIEIRRFRYWSLHLKNNNKLKKKVKKIPKHVGNNKGGENE